MRKLPLLTGENLVHQRGRTPYCPDKCARRRRTGAMPEKRSFRHACRSGNLSARIASAVMIGVRRAACPSESFVGSYCRSPTARVSRAPPLASWSLRLYGHRGMCASSSRHSTIDKTPSGGGGGRDNERHHDWDRGERGPAVPNRSTSGRRDELRRRINATLADQELVTDRSGCNWRRYRTRALLDDRVDWRRCGATERAAAVQDRDRQAGHSLHP